MKNFKIIILFLCLNLGFSTGCSDYLDIVPDNIVDVDDVFGSRINADKFLKTCYGYLPTVVRPFHDPNWIASKSDELWYYQDAGQFPSLGWGNTPMGLAVMEGGQNASDPYLNYWDGALGADKNFLWEAIRECNIFLENVEENNVVPDMSAEERVWWIGEVRFLKAYYHFYLMHLYGPIPIIDRNLEISATPDEVRIFREPIDDVVNFIVEQIEKAEEYLIEAESDKQVGGNNDFGGRITTSIAKAVKAKVLVWAASRLFNGNEFYINFKDPRSGLPLIPAGDPDIEKWQRAADACREAIEWIELGQYHELYSETSTNNSIPNGVSAETRLKYKLRYAVTDPFNREIIWPSTHPTTGFNGSAFQHNLWQMSLARESMPTFRAMASGSGNHSGSIGTTLNMAEQFYTSNGLFIEDDEEWLQYIGGRERRYDTRQVGASDTVYHKYYLMQGATTAQLNFRREPRFYAYVGFDGGIWEGAGQSEDESYWVNKRSTLLNQNIPTGYYMKKVVSPASSFSPSSTAYTVQSEPYTFPYMRLAELYLLYAEAINEAEGPNGPNRFALFKYIDAVRTRAGLLGVEATWNQSMSNKKRYETQNGMREIIRKERTVELCFEGKRGEDMRRWREAHIEFSKPIRGWNGPVSSTNEGYYRIREYYTPSYTTKDYLWPIRARNIDVNRNLVQNPGW
jgi:hypothetical protein